MSNLSLWEIDEALQELLLAEQEALDPDEQKQIGLALTQYRENKITKIDAIRGLIKHAGMMAAAAKAEEAFQKDRRKRWEALADSVKAIAKESMQAHGQTIIHGRTGDIRLKNNGGKVPVVVNNLDLVPDGLCNFTGKLTGLQLSVVLGLVRQYFSESSGDLFQEILDTLQAFKREPSLERIADALASDCVECEGKGLIECSTCDGGRGNILPYCPECKLKYDPSREVPLKSAKCSACGGSGKTHVPGAIMGERGNHIEV